MELAVLLGAVVSDWQTENQETKPHPTQMQRPPSRASVGDEHLRGG
jgi:hypothetical protein